MGINPQTPETLYAGTLGGVFKSNNSGTSWTAMNTGLTSTDVYALAINPQTPATLYAGTLGGGVFMFSTRDEIIGTGGAWSNGIWYYNLATNTWSKPYSSTPSGPIAVGEVNGDGKADMVSCWPSGLWYQNGATLGWTQVYSVVPSNIAVGDISGDGRAEIIGAWSSGIWYFNPAISGWTKM